MYDNSCFLYVYISKIKIIKMSETTRKILVFSYFYIKIVHLAREQAIGEHAEKRASTSRKLKIDNVSL
jgi:hypothetical protein